MGPGFRQDDGGVFGTFILCITRQATTARMPRPLGLATSASGMLDHPDARVMTPNSLFDS
jgi:hypothetical protein